MSSKKKKLKYFTGGRIEGKVNNGLINAELVLKLGQAVGILFRGGDPHDPDQVVIGKDPRLSGYMLEPALTAGLISAGANVFLTGPLPIYGVSALVPMLRADVGVMISSPGKTHESSGIHLFGPDGHRLPDDKLLKIEKLIQNGPAEHLLAKSSELGRAKRLDGAQDRYIELVKPRQVQFDGLRVAVDCANGASYKVAPQVLRELGAEVVPINIEPGGLNINENCGANAPKGLIQKAHEVRADLGLALDGDGGNFVLVDERVRVVDLAQIPPEALRTETGTRDGLSVALYILAKMVTEGKKASQLFPPSPDQ